MAQSNITLTFTKKEFFLITETLRASYNALIHHPLLDDEHKEIAEAILKLGDRMLEQARTENKDW